MSQWLAKLWTPEGISLTGIYIFTTLTCWALVLQIRRIWIERSGLAMSVPWITYFAAMFTVGTIYGWAHDQTVMINNGVYVVLHLIVAYSLWKFKGFTRAERWFCGLLIVAVATMFMDRVHDGYWFIGFGFGGVVSLWRQTMEMWTRRTCGVVEPRLLLISLAANIFWTAYAYTTANVLLRALCPMNLTMFVIMVGVW